MERPAELNQLARIRASGDIGSKQWSENYAVLERGKEHRVDGRVSRMGGASFTVG
jgi:hypothetical protein